MPKLHEFQDFHSCYRTPRLQKGFRRVSEGVSEEVSERVLKDFRRVLEGVSRRTLQKPFTTPSRTLRKPLHLVDVSDIFYFFLFRGGGKGGGVRGGGWGGGLIKNRGRGGGGVPTRRRGRGEGRRGNVCGEEGGGAKYFFSGPKCPPSSRRCLEIEKA